MLSVLSASWMSSLNLPEVAASGVASVESASMLATSLAVYRVAAPDCVLGFLPQQGPGCGHRACHVWQLARSVSFRRLVGRADAQRAGRRRPTDEAARDVVQLVDQQLSAVRTARVETPGCEGHLAAHCVGMRPHRVRGLCCPRIGVDSDVGEVVAEPVLHVPTSDLGQRLPRGSKHVVHDWRRVLRPRAMRMPMQCVFLVVALASAALASAAAPQGVDRRRGQGGRPSHGQPRGAGGAGHLLSVASARHRAVTR